MPDIRPGQIYEACHPLDNTRLRVRSYTPGDERAVVTDTTGRFPRRIRVTSLHPTGLTKTGRPRRTGYRLVKDAEADGELREAPRATLNATESPTDGANPASPTDHTNPTPKGRPTGLSAAEQCACGLPDCVAGDEPGGRQ